VFIRPIKSTKLNLFIVGNLSKELKSRNISDIKNKMMIFDLDDNNMMALSIINS